MEPATVTTITPQPSTSVVPADAATILDVISRASRDPATDVDKLERLLLMYERITATRSKAAFDAALAEMQPKMPVVDRRGEITIRDKNNRDTIIQSTPYALFEDIHKAVTPILHEHGFALSFRTSADGKVKVTAVLSHREGHREETSLELMHDSTGSKNSVQAIGSSISYGKRYTMCAMLNIATKGEDDDGLAAGGITEDQCKELSALIAETKTDLAKFLAHMEVDAMFQIPAAQFERAKHALLQKKKAAKVA